MQRAERRRVLWTAVACAFCTFFGLVGLTPLYPRIALDLGLGPDVLSVLLSVSSCAAAALQIPVGVVSDRIGRRPVLLLGLVTMTLSLLLRWQASSAWLFGLAQLAVGASLPLLVAPSYAVVADAYNRVGRAQALGLVGSSINLGQVVGFLVAGAVGPLIGWRGFSLGLAVLPLVLLAPVLTMPEPPRSRATASIGSGTWSAVRFMLRPQAAGLALNSALVLAAGIAATYLLPFAASSRGYSASATSVLLVPFVAGSVIGPPLIGRWADRSGLQLPMVACAGMGLVGLCGFAIAGFGVAAVVGCFVLIGASMQSTIGLASAAIVDLGMRVGAGSGAALGGLRVGQNLGPAIGPVVASVVYLRGGLPAAFGVLALAVALGAIGQLVFSRTVARALPGGPR